MRIAGIGYTPPPSAIVIKKEVSDEEVLDVLRTELMTRMEPENIDKWISTIAQICEETGIEPKRLPVNKQYPGDLTPEENHEILMSIFDVVV